MLGTLVFAPLVIQIFYSARFGPAVEVLRWFCLGMMLRVATWPMGFIVLAKGARNIFFWAEVGINALHVALAFIFIRMFGLRGAGIAFFALYATYWIPIYIISRDLTGFRWSSSNRRLGFVFALLIAVVWGG